MIWLLAYPLSPVKTEKERQLADWRERKGVEEEPNHSTARKFGPPLFINLFKY
jgi:hypothetical protein